MAVLPSDLPPAYSTLFLTEEVAIIGNHDSAPLIGKTFGEKNARVMFTQKVLSIFLLQTIAVGIVLGCFAYYRVIITHDLFGVAVVIYLLTICVMACIDQVKNRQTYNCIMLIYYPICITFIIVMVPALFDDYSQMKIRMAFLSAWMSYVTVGAVVLFYCIFSLDCKHDFKFLEKLIITISVYVGTYFGIYIPLSVRSDDFDPISTLWLSILLYVHYLYVLYDIDVMTSGQYRSNLTPADYITGAVNCRIDFLFIIKDFIKEKCGCGNVQ